jgi:prophage regulatory protein
MGNRCEELDVTRILSFADLRPRGISHHKVTLWRLEKAGKFPKRVHISPGKVGWVEREIEAYIEERIAARGEAA